MKEILFTKKQAEFKKMLQEEHQRMLKVDKNGKNALDRAIEVLSSWYEREGVSTISAHLDNAKWDKEFTQLAFGKVTPMYLCVSYTEGVPPTIEPTRIYEEGEGECILYSVLYRGNTKTDSRHSKEIQEIVSQIHNSVFNKEFEAGIVLRLWHDSLIVQATFGSYIERMQQEKQRLEEVIPRHNVSRVALLRQYLEEWYKQKGQPNYIGVDGNIYNEKWDEYFQRLGSDYEFLDVCFMYLCVSANVEIEPRIEPFTLYDEEKGEGVNVLLSVLYSNRTNRYSRRWDKVEEELKEVQEVIHRELNKSKLFKIHENISDFTLLERE